MPSDDLEKTLRDYVVNQLLHGEDRGLDGKSPLLEWGVLESMSLISLVNFIGSDLGVEVPEEELRPDNFANLESIATLVRKLRRA